MKILLLLLLCLSMVSHANATHVEEDCIVKIEDLKRDTIAKVQNINAAASLSVTTLSNVDFTSEAPLRIGVNNREDFHALTINGDLHGLIPIFTLSIEHLLDIPVEFIYADEARLLTYFENNEVDILFGHVYSEYNADIAYWGPHYFLDSIEFSNNLDNDELTLLRPMFNKQRGEAFATLFSELFGHLQDKLFKEYLVNLKEHYFSLRFQDSLTEAERLYLSQHDMQIPIYLESRLFPYSFVIDGRIQGAIIDLLNDVTQLTGIEFHINNQPNTEWKRLLKLSQQSPGLFFLADTELSLDDFTHSAPVFSIDRYLITHKKILNKNIFTDSIGILNSKADKKYIEMLFGDMNIKLIASKDEGVNKLLKNEISFMMLTSGELDYYQNFLFHSQLRAFKKVNSIDAVLGFKTEEHTPELAIALSIINKALPYLSNKSVYFNNWKTVAHDTAKMLRFYILGLIILILVILLGLAKIKHDADFVRKQRKVFYRVAYVDESTGYKNMRSLSDALRADGRKNTFIFYFYPTSSRMIESFKAAMRKFNPDYYCTYYLSSGCYCIIEELTSVNSDNTELAMSLHNKMSTFGAIHSIAHIIPMGCQHSKEDISRQISRLKQAKEYLGDNIKSFSIVLTEDLQAEINKINGIKETLQQSVTDKKIVPYYQGKVDVKSKKLKSCEALARWDHELYGFISPGVFIPIAESMGLIFNVDMCMLEASLVQIKQWHLEDKVDDTFKISSNLSNLTIQNERFTKEIELYIFKYKDFIKYLEIEVTESVVGNNKIIIERILYLKKHGFKVAMDDFSTGHSSLKNLSIIEYDVLKLDKELLPDSLLDYNKIKILKTILELSKRDKLEIVMEGVETQQQSEIVESLGINTIQGFYYYKPEPAHQFERYLKAR